MADRLVELINSATAETNTNKKVEYLYQVKELAFKDGLIFDFFPDIIAFQSGAPNVKKFCLAFLEDACKQDCKLCPDAIVSLNLLLNDPNTEVVKRSIQAATQFYRSLVRWITTANISTDAENTTTTTIDTAVATRIEQTWISWSQIINFICGLLETTNNDGVRTHCIKFIETVVLMQTPPDKYTDPNLDLNLIEPMITPIGLSTDIKVNQLITNDQLPKTGVLFNEEHKLQLVEAAKKRFEQLVVFHGTPHISSVNLMAAMQSLVVLAKQRYRLFMGRVIQAMETLNNKLPPTLTDSQIQSVKKFLKLQLTVMLKHPYSLDRFQQQITQLLQAVGSKQPDIHRVISDFQHKFGGSKPQLATSNASATAIPGQQDVTKRIKLEPGMTISAPVKQPSVQPPQTVHMSKSKHLDLNKLTQELDEKEKRRIVVDSVRRILGEEGKGYISPVKLDIKKKVLSTLANEFNNTECPKLIQDYIFDDIKNRHEICYAVIKKNFEVAASKAAKRNINLLDNQNLLKNFNNCFHSYLNRAMDLKDIEDRDVILPRLYALKDEYYTLFEGGSQQTTEVDANI